MTSDLPTVLILPGLYNSGDGHWQTHWERSMPNARRVQQHSWDAPDRAAWVAALDAAIREAAGPVVLAAHSLGCALAAWWAGEHGAAPHAAKVAGALLVALPDVERKDFPGSATGFAPMPRRRLPFKAIVAASSDDPWCGIEKAASWARDWQAGFHDLGPLGHINAESGLGDWPRGRAWLAELQA
ncbi:RBBP9/YdeN family alpha/beta hydrolase [Noviherbaspirillum galbum]|uniref:Alpha/beta hydrolase n=1 Tax=Noviherbaspirillum galbum TaxID=2709383 RepID=A0A6B3SSQ0_9BURK|nr:alpha/beta hydrolase [Noviherbaspirillum galbum]NEX63498.1 alpha/beta hydrolase [Noviherbaspirillum galbum]